MYLTYKDVLKLPINTIIYSESNRERYKIIYNLGKLLVKRFRSDGDLEKKTKELSKQEIEENNYH